MSTFEILLETMIIKALISSMSFMIKWGWQGRFPLDSSVFIQFDLLQICGQVGVIFIMVPSRVGNDNNGIGQDMDHLMFKRFFLEFRNGQVFEEEYGKELNNTENGT